MGESDRVWLEENGFRPCQGYAANARERELLDSIYEKELGDFRLAVYEEGSGYEALATKGGASLSGRGGTPKAAVDAVLGQMNALGLIF